MVYKFKNSSHISGIDPQVVGETIDHLREKYGTATNELLVDAARPEQAPLHNYFFSRNDAELAQERRLAMAGHLIRCVVQVKQTDSGPKHYTAFVNVSPASERIGHYTTTAVAFSDEQMKENVLQRALSELRAFRHKYQSLKELAEVFAAIDAAEEQFSEAVAAKKEMLDKQMKKAKTAKAAKNPEQDYEDSFYRDDDGDFAFPDARYRNW